MSINSSRPTFTKDPSAVLDYVLDLTDWLEASNDTLLSAEAVGDGVTVDSCSVAGKGIVVWVSGGTANTVAYVRVKFTTSNTPPRVDERTLRFRIRDR